ncbi:hypothetical protein DHC50_16330 [Arenibacter sp. A80]|nr:hypothetical protein [Arenibacter sp. A80]RFT55028.1 hypothetical protein D0S24_16325 [Arenibacter sp. P308M17]
MLPLVVVMTNSISMKKNYLRKVFFFLHISISTIYNVKWLKCDLIYAYFHLWTVEFKLIYPKGSLDLIILNNHSRFIFNTPHYVKIIT